MMNEPAAMQLADFSGTERRPTVDIVLSFNLVAVQYNRDSTI